ncbi:MAG: polysaccharide deacetylase family protein, partial [Chloroflexota bacterium]
MLTLLYHNILTQPADDLPLASYQVTLAQFRQQITRLRSRLLDPRDVQEAILRGRRPDGVLITFDDGASGVLDASHALAEIGAVGLT